MPPVGSGLLLVAVTFCAVPSVETERIRTTFGRSGQVCEEGFRKCLAWKSTCVNNTCLCTSGFGWRGDFSCYPTEVYHAEILNDPTVKNFGRRGVSLPVTCRYLFSHFRTNFSGAMNGGTCEVLVHAFNQKHLGKIYLHGFDLALRVSGPAPSTLRGEISTRVYGTASKGTYTFQESGTLAFAPDGPWTTYDPSVFLEIYDTVARVRYDPYNNFVLFQVPTCGFSLRFRPFDLEYGKNQVQVPGLSLSVDPLYEPTWLSLDRVIALVPTGEPSLDSISSQTGLSPRDAILLRLAQSSVTQNQPDAASECSDLMDTVTSCAGPSQSRLPFEVCSFIPRTALLVRCVDDSSNGNQVLGLYRRCFEAVCSQNKLACNQVQAEVASCPAILDLEPVARFLEPSTCQFI